MQLINPFPIYRRFLTPVQQTTFENIGTKVEIAQNEQFLLLQQCFQLFSVIIPSFIESFHALVLSVQSRLLQICLYVKANFIDVDR